MSNIRVTFNANGGNFNIQKLPGATSSTYVVNTDNTTILILPTNNHISRSNCLLIGWSMTQYNADGSNKEIGGAIFKGTYSPSMSNTTLYAVWCEVETMPTLGISTNFKRNTSINTVPFSKLSEQEKDVAISQASNNEYSTVTFYTEYNNMPYKAAVRFSGTGWTLSQVMADTQHDGEGDILYRDVFESSDFENKRIVWYRKSVELNTYDKIYDGDVLKGVVFDDSQHKLYALPVIYYKGDYNEGVIHPKYGDDANITIEGELLHTKSPYGDNKVLNATNFGTVDIYDLRTHDTVFNSVTSVKNYVDCYGGNKFTLKATANNGCKFIGWFRREEIIKTDEHENTSGYLGYYQISGSDQNKLDVTVEKEDTYNQYAALFVGEPESTDFSERDYTETISNASYYYWNGKLNGGLNTKDFTPITENTIYFPEASQCKPTFVILSKQRIDRSESFEISSEFDKASIDIKLNVENDSETVVIESMPVGFTSAHVITLPKYPTSSVTIKINKN